MQPLHTLFLYKRTPHAPQSTPSPSSSPALLLPLHSTAPPLLTLSTTSSNPPLAHHSPSKPTSQTKAPVSPQHSSTLMQLTRSTEHTPPHNFVPSSPPLLLSHTSTQNFSPKYSLHPTTSSSYPSSTPLLASLSHTLFSLQTYLSNQSPQYPPAFLHTDATNPLHRVHPSPQLCPRALSHYHYPAQALNASPSNTPFTLNTSSSHTFHHPKHPLHHSPSKPTSQTKTPSIPQLSPSRTATTPNPFSSTNPSYNPPQHSPTLTATTPYKCSTLLSQHSLHPTVPPLLTLSITSSNPPLTHHSPPRSTISNQSPRFSPVFPTH
ncbi:hypothetical protein GGR10_000525 [Bartonella chomelii]|uniref:Uncharacterized protein n=1 Tax=Bartonella chomelii TaxID=236402 RepID=A0ABR6E290_9HYPH|nr:hypothetical protein [Bartonella chomelii]